MKGDHGIEGCFVHAVGKYGTGIAVYPYDAATDVAWQDHLGFIDARLVLRLNAV